MVKLTCWEVNSGRGIHILHRVPLYHEPKKCLILKYQTGYNKATAIECKVIIEMPYKAQKISWHSNLYFHDRHSQLT